MSSPWNHGKISRNAAEQLLVANGKNGAFLVRQSESVNDAYVLSLWYVEMRFNLTSLHNISYYIFFLFFLNWSIWFNTTPFETFIVQSFKINITFTTV
jgi:hypothetical protein